MQMHCRPVRREVSGFLEVVAMRRQQHILKAESDAQVFAEGNKPGKLLHEQLFEQPASGQCAAG